MCCGLDEDYHTAAASELHQDMSTSEQAAALLLYSLRRRSVSTHLVFRCNFARLYEIRIPVLLATGLAAIFGMIFVHACSPSPSCLVTPVGDDEHMP